MKKVMICVCALIITFMLAACSTDQQGSIQSEEEQSMDSLTETEDDTNQRENDNNTSGTEGNDIHETEYTTPDGDTGYIYLTDTIRENPEEKVPMVFVMAWTTGETRSSAISCGWVEKALEENFIVVAPDYNNAATYSQTDRLVSALRYITENYPVDTTRIYSTGFSNGGAASVALTNDYPELFAAISAMGWMVDMRSPENETYDMPFQVIQGTEEYTYETAAGEMAIMEDEQNAIRSLFQFNEMMDDSEQADYERTPYWGYEPDDFYERDIDGRKWEFNQFHKDGYDNPFAQFVLIPDAGHEPNENDAEIAWEFFRHFSRNEDGKIVETQ